MARSLLFEIIGNQIALGIDRMTARDDDGVPEPAEVVAANVVPSRRRTLVYYRDDDCIFIDDEYLIRNVPARILWKLLGEYRDRGRTDFTNRELRLDAGLALPEIKDNLESRLILLRKRLEEKSPDVRIKPSGRGRFTLAIESELELVER